GLLVFSPWLIRNAVWAGGNPVFPEAMRLLGRAHFSEVQVERWERAHAPRDDQKGLAGRAAAVNAQILSDWRYGLLLLPAAAIVGYLNRRMPESKFLALLVVAL